jgi:hypothetical protein
VKKFLVMFVLLASVFTLVACGGEEPKTLTSIEFAGVEDLSVANGATFNVLTDVKATGDDDQDYTDQITIETTSQAVNTTTGVLDTKQAGVHFVRYSVEVEEVVARYSRYITVLAPVAEEGQMLVNPDFEEGVSGWNDPSVVYIADGASMTLSEEDGALKAEVIPGFNFFTPRFGQMNVPFENGKTYEISFDAKSTVEKEIILQVGELLSAAPYFTDFLPAADNLIEKVIGTEWATYSFKFTMLQDNPRGGLIFGLGTVSGQAIAATLYFDNVVIEESTPDLDVTGPVFAGLSEAVTITTGTNYNPLAGITALDVTDGDVTESITYVIKNAEGNIVTELDTSLEGTFTIEYSVSDSLGNETVEVVTLNIVGMTFTATSQILNGDFAGADLTPWSAWWQDWGDAPAVTVELVDGAAEITTDKGGDANWAIQFIQTNIELVEGQTYQLSFDAKATAARDINVVFYNDDTKINYIESGSVMLTEEMDTYNVLFTMTAQTITTQLQFLLGNTTNFAAGTITLDNIVLSTIDGDAIVKNSQFDALGFDTFVQNWGDAPNASFVVEDGKFAITTDKGGDANWAIQFNQNLTLKANTTYVLSFDASTATPRDIFAKIFQDVTYIFYVEELVMLSEAGDTFTFEFTTTDAIDNVKLSFEFGLTDNFAAGTVYLDNISLKEKVEAAPELIINGTATEPTDWSLFTEGDGQATVEVVSGEAVINVTGLGGAAYQPHFYQMIGDLAAGNYVIKIVLDSEVARTIRFNLILPDAGYASILPDTFLDLVTTGEGEQVVYLEFTVNNPVTNVKLEFDFGTIGGESISAIGEFILSEVLIYRDYN